MKSPENSPRPCEQVARQIRLGEIPGLRVPAPAAPRTPEVADVRKLNIKQGRGVYSRVAGVFLFVPFLVKMQLDAMVEEAGMAGTKRSRTKCRCDSSSIAKR